MLDTKIANILLQLRAAADKITATPADYGFDAGAATALDAAVTAAETAAADQATYETLKQAKVAATQTALTTVVDLFRLMAAQARTNPDVTDESLADLGTARKSPPSRIGPPPDAPELSVEALGIGYVNVRNIEPNTASAKLPPEAIGLEISIVNAAADAQPGEADTGVKTFHTKSRTQVSTDLGFASVRMYSRYIGKRAQTGPWSIPFAFSPAAA